MEGSFGYATGSVGSRGTVEKRLHEELLGLDQGRHCLRSVRGFVGLAACLPVQLQKMTEISFLLVYGRVCSILF